MLVDRYKAEDVFSRVPRMAARIDPVLSKLDQLLDDDELYHQVRNDFGKRYRYTLVHGRHSTPALSPTLFDQSEAEGKSPARLGLVKR